MAAGESMCAEDEMEVETCWLCNKTNPDGLWTLGRRVHRWCRNGIRARVREVGTETFNQLCRANEQECKVATLKYVIEPGEHLSKRAEARRMEATMTSSFHEDFHQDSQHTTRGRIKYSRVNFRVHKG